MKSIIPVLILIFLSGASISAQLLQNNDSFTNIFYSKYLSFSSIGNRQQDNELPDSTDWRALIDARWGQGLPTANKLQIFNNFVDVIDHGYGAFVNYDVNLDSLRYVYLPEIAAGVSKGRFVGIMNHINFLLCDLHSWVKESTVNVNTQPTRNTPLFVVGSAYNSSRFGAALTPLPDSTLLVFKSRSNQRLGLQPGDIVLGYDGRPWIELMQELIDAEMPLLEIGPLASDPDARTHILLQSCGENWHLFDTIDIIKYQSGDTLHLSTDPLMYQSGFLYGNEQLPVPGVPMHDVTRDEHVTWGVVEGTQIGYIYVVSWSYLPQHDIYRKFHDAVDSLMFSRETSGMIIDFRINGGGYMPMAHGGYELLFNKYITAVDFDMRDDSTDHFSMKDYPGFTAGEFTIPGDSNTYYDKPIAVLIGPNAVSNGDWEAFRMKLHPMVRTFGKATNGGFTINDYPSIGNINWSCARGFGAGYVIDGHRYLAHLGVEPDEAIWLTPDGVAQGIDDVVEAAIDWINTTTSVKESNDQQPQDFLLYQNYPNPFNPSTTISFTIPETSFVTLNVYNMLGQEVAKLIHKEMAGGNYRVEFNAANLTSGIYFYSINAGGCSAVKKMLLMK